MSDGYVFLTGDIAANEPDGVNGLPEKGFYSVTARHAVDNGHNAVAQHQERNTTGLAARIEQLTRWMTQDRQHVHIQETAAER